MRTPLGSCLRMIPPVYGPESILPRIRLECFWPTDRLGHLLRWRDLDPGLLQTSLTIGLLGVHLELEVLALPHLLQSDDGRLAAWDDLTVGLAI